MPHVTMATIAAKAGVSKNTVSLALRSDPQIPAETRQRIAKIAKALGYTRNPVVAQLMSELRKTQPAGYRRTLALINANQDPGAFSRHPTIPHYVAGCRRRADFHGYKLDEFWLHDPDLTGPRLNRILRTRGIKGVLIVGLMKENRLPAQYEDTWSLHATVVTGVRTRQPTLPFCCVDHHALVLQAMENALQLGYARPALVVDEHIDQLVEGRFSAGMAYAQQSLPAIRRVPGFYAIEEARRDRSVFDQWIRKHEPDALLTLYNAVHDWVTDLGYKVPRDIGLIQLERRRGNEEWTGMDQHNDLTGEAAIDMLVGMLHNNEAGIQPFPRATLISGSWSLGKTTRDKPAR